MGNLFKKAEKNLVSFPLAVDKFVEGGDLLFMEDRHYFDEYTIMNPQTMHVFKKCLRLKSDIKDFGIINQWCKIAIILDSDVDDIKYVLELTEEGFIKTEYVQRVLALKAQGIVFGIKRLIQPLDYEQTFRLRMIADMLTSKLSPDSGNYARIFNLSQEEEEDLQETKRPAIKILKARRGEDSKFKKKKGGDDADVELETAEGDDDDGNYVDMVRQALKDTRKILGEITQGSALWEQIHEIFNVFSGRLGEEDEGFEDIKLSKDDNTENKGVRIELLALPKFVNYFRVTGDDDEYFDNFIDRVSVLAEQEYYVDNGVDFEHLLTELHAHGFLLGSEITEKEPHAVIQAQVILQILIRLRLIESTDLYTGNMKYRDVNDLEELRDGVTDEVVQPFGSNVYYPLRTVWYQGSK